MPDGAILALSRKIARPWSQQVSVRLLHRFDRHTIKPNLATLLCWPVSLRSFQGCSDGSA